MEILLFLEIKQGLLRVILRVLQVPSPQGKPRRMLLYLWGQVVVVLMSHSYLVVL